MTRSSRAPTWRPTSLEGQSSAGVWLVGNKWCSNRSTVAIVRVESLASSVVLVFLLVLFASFVLSRVTAGVFSSSAEI